MYTNWPFTAHTHADTKHTTCLGEHMKTTIINVKGEHTDDT